MGQGDRDPALYRYLPMTGVLLIWGFMNVPTTFALYDISPLQLLLWRTVLASAMTAGIGWMQERRFWPYRCDLFIAVMMGLWGVIGNNLFFFYAVKHTSLTNLAIIFATSPLMTTVLAALFLGEKLSVRKVCGVTLALSGAVFLLCRGDLEVLKSLTLNSGDLSEFGAAFCCSVLTVLGRKVKRSSAVTVTFCTMFASLIVVALLFTVTGASPALPVTGLGWFGVLYMGILGSGAGYMLQQISVGRIGASATGAFLNGTPAVSIFSAMIFMGESISAVQLISAAVIFVGIFLNAGAKTK